MTGSAPVLPGLRRLGTVCAGTGPATFEQLGQASGLVLYTARPVLPPGESVLSVIGLRDRATVYVDGTPLGVLERSTCEDGVRVTGHGRRVTLELLVENLGRVNYGPRLGEHKGIAGDVLVDRRIVHGWHSRSLPLDLLEVDDLWQAARAGGDADCRREGVLADAAGVVARAELIVDAPADTFLALPGWTKGFVWVGDVLLGRYWDRGPQRTFYVPAPLLRPGMNDITVLELHTPGAAIELRDVPELGEPEDYVEEL